MGPGEARTRWNGAEAAASASSSSVSVRIASALIVRSSCCFVSLCSLLPPGLAGSRKKHEEASVASTGPLTRLFCSGSLAFADPWTPSVKGLGDTQSLRHQRKRRLRTLFDHHRDV